MKNTLLFIWNANILVRLLTVNIMQNCFIPKNPKMCNPKLVTLLKMRPHYSQSSRENATPSNGTSPLASHEEVPPPPPATFDFYYFWLDLWRKIKGPHNNKKNKTKKYFCENRGVGERWGSYAARQIVQRGNEIIYPVLNKVHNFKTGYISCESVSRVLPCTIDLIC